MEYEYDIVLIWNIEYFNWVCVHVNWLIAYDQLLVFLHTAITKLSSVNENVSISDIKLVCKFQEEIEIIWVVLVKPNQKHA